MEKKQLFTEFEQGKKKLQAVIENLNE